LVVGRDKEENQQLLNRAGKGSAVIDGTTLPGPLCLLTPDRAEDHQMAAAICARYSDQRDRDIVTVNVRGSELKVAPARPEDASRLLIV